TSNLMFRSIIFLSTATSPTIYYTLSLHDALPIFGEHWVDDLALDCLADVKSSQGELALMLVRGGIKHICRINLADGVMTMSMIEDRKSTRLNSSHRTISYAVFCLKKKNYIK